MAKRRALTIRIEDACQASSALRIPGLSDATKLELLGYIADSGDVQYVRQHHESDLFESIPGAEGLKERFAEILANAKTRDVVVEKMEAARTPREIATLLDIAADSSPTAYGALIHCSGKLSPEQQLRLVPVALRYKGGWGDRESKLIPLFKKLGGVPIVRAHLLELAIKAGGSAGESLLKATGGNDPLQLTAEERSAAVNSVSEDQLACMRILGHYPEETGLWLSADEARLLVPSFLALCRRDSIYWRRLENEGLRSILTDEQRAEADEILALPAR